MRNLNLINFKGITLLSLLIFHLFILINTSFTLWPVMILYPWLMSHGYTLYSEIINPYFPLLPITLKNYFDVFSYNILNLKIFTYSIIVILDLIVFIFALKLSKKFIKAILSLIFYILLQFSYGGNALWFELFLSPFILVGLFLLFENQKSKKISLISGILLALAVLSKQNAAAFYLPTSFLLISRRNFQNLPFLFLPGIVLVIILFSYYFYSNNFQDFYKWSILLPLTYSSQPGFVSLPAIRQYLIISFPLISLLGLAKISDFTNRNYHQAVSFAYWSLSFLIALSFAFPRYENFHLQLLIGLSAVFVSLLNRNILTVVIIISSLIFFQGFTKAWHKPDRFIDQSMLNLSKKTKNLDSVYILNGPDLAYFFSGKLPPKIWAENFPWYFKQVGFEDKFIDGLSKDTKSIIIGDKLGGGKYDLGNYIPEKLMIYIEINYSRGERFENFQIWHRK